jgi:peptidoglycan/xylan/chitin deacetylase (PgdA/CDA1 family)
MKNSLITISVDDGHPTDLRMADLLAEFDLKATFYIPATDDRLHLPILTNGEIRQLATQFEVGSHTLHHVALTEMPLDISRREIIDGKSWLEDVVERPVRAFCYPRGKFNSDVARLVAEAGFDGARTSMQNVVAPSRHAYAWGVSTHAFSHSRLVQLRHAALEQNWQGLANFVRVFRMKVDWEEHFELAAQHVARHGGIAHLILHSWEIDFYDAWEKLRRLLASVRDGYSLIPITNGDLFRGAATR